MSIPACIWDYSNFNPEGPAHRNRQRFKLLLLAGHTLLKVATNAQTSGWHLWTVIIPRRSISGKLSFPDKSGDDAVARSGLPRNLSNAQIGTSQGRVRGTKRQSGDFTWSEHNEANRRRRHGQTGIEPGGPNNQEPFARQWGKSRPRAFQLTNDPSRTTVCHPRQLEQGSTVVWSVRPPVD